MLEVIIIIAFLIPVSDLTDNSIFSTFLTLTIGILISQWVTQPIRRFSQVSIDIPLVNGDRSTSKLQKLSESKVEIDRP